jgi:putative addiction module component (TIGR02574 family)
MARATDDLLHEALELPLDERAKIAAELLESLHEVESEVDAAWAEEIRARASAVHDGELAGTDWRIVLDQVEKDVLGR